MMAKHSVNKVHHGLYRGDRSVNGYKMCHLADSVDKDQDNRSIVSVGRKPEDEVHPSFSRNR